MREFFRGWKRKAGVVTLVMALPVMGLWVRSAIVYERALIPCRKSIQYIASGGHAFFWAASEVEREGMFSHFPTEWQYVPYVPENYPDCCRIPLWDMDSTTRWELNFCGFHFIEGEIDSRDYTRKLRGSIWVFHYWSIVTPLTLLSAWLLLSKPRRTIPLKPSEPAPAEAP